MARRGAFFSREAAAVRPEGSPKEARRIVRFSPESSSGKIGGTKSGENTYFAFCGGFNYIEVNGLGQISARAEMG